MFKILALSFVLLPSLAQAWEMDEKSSLRFVPVQSGQKIQSEFTEFDVEANIPADISDADFTVDVNVLSAHTDYGQVADYFTLPVWFDSENFPKAKFVSTNIERIEGSRYKIKGDLTLKDVTAPVEGEFVVQEKTNKTFAGEFTFNINRLTFNVGNTEEWGEGSIVEKDVKVISKLYLTK